MIKQGKVPSQKGSGIPTGMKYVVVILLAALIGYSNLDAIAEDSHSDVSYAEPIYAEKKSFVGEKKTNFLLDVKNACPASEKINKVNDFQPYSKLMGLGDIHSVLNYWYEFNCPKGSTTKSCNFHSIGQHLLHHAIQRNETLLTVQVGAMDGRSNDPMYDMFVKENFKYVQGRESVTGALPTIQVEAMDGRSHDTMYDMFVKKKFKYVQGRKSFTDLRNWLPVMIEPVPRNYEVLLETYSNISKTNGLGCAVPINAAVSYDASKTTCPFCRTNTAKDAPEICDLPDFKKYQLGTLDCEYSKNYFKEKFDICILQDPLPCSSITNLLSNRSIPSQNIGMLQIDVEGYEYILLEGFLEEVPKKMLPPIIHYEHKVMKHLDKRYRLKDGKSRLMTAEKLLIDKGYALHYEGEDVLALRVGELE